jgi:hypothetical protein
MLIDRWRQVLVVPRRGVDVRSYLLTRIFEGANGFYYYYLLYSDTYLVKS